jgi:hypothetical protein
MSKVVIEGELCSWMAGEPFATVMVKNPSYPSRPCSEDWASLSGRRVRVTVEAIEPEVGDRLAGCKCKECGGPLSVRDYTEGHTYIKYPYVVWCKHCNRERGSYAESADAAIDAYLAAQKVEPRCPHCGGKIAMLDLTIGVGPDKGAAWAALCKCGAHGDGVTKKAALDALRAWKIEPKCPFCGGKVWFTAHTWETVGKGPCKVDCACGAHGEGKTVQAALDALVEYLAPCPRCGKGAGYRGERYMRNGKESWKWSAMCADIDCGIHSPQYDTKAAAAQWWNKRAP